MALSVGLELSNKNCRELAKQASDPELDWLCDSLETSKKPKSKSAKPFEFRPATENPGKQIFENKCAVCHDNN